MKVVVSDSKGKQFEEEFDVAPNARVSDAH
jgi:hypothetical protein